MTLTQVNQMRNDLQEMSLDLSATNATNTSVMDSM